jgi:predicted membrane protein DUF2306
MSTVVREPVARRRRVWPVAVLGIATVVMVGYLLSAYIPPDMSTSRVPPRNELHYVLLVAHIATAAVASLAGAIQFLPAVRRRFPAVHRWTGRAYFFLGVFPSMVLAIPVAALAPFGASNQAALFALDALWIVTAIAGYRAVRQHRYADHRRWMIRNYALIWGSLASRFWIPVMAVAILPQLSSESYHGSQLAMIHDMSSGSAWLGLVSAVLVAEWHLQRRYGVPTPRRAGSAGRRQEGVERREYQVR